jgi:alkylation response protein AidB-like acyl-CoA dehydrogenase
MSDTTSVDAPSIETFRDEALRFLQANAEPRVEATLQWGEGTDRVALVPYEDEVVEAAGIAEARRWRAKVFDAGFAWVSGPTEFGGRGLPDAYESAYHECERRFRTPSKAYFSVGMGMIAPTVLAHGTDEQRRRHLPGIVAGDRIACQLFSEPDAGSDLASVRCRAVRDGDAWIIEGQKLWSSGAHFSDVGEIICRTGTPEDRHRGLTAFLVDMHADGVDVRPMRQMTGGASFNEVVLDGVRVDDRDRLGPVGSGWAVALTTLMNERGAIGSTTAAGQNILSIVRLVELARRCGRDDDAAVRQAITRAHIGLATARYTRQRVTAHRQAGRAPGPEMSIAKLAFTRNLQLFSDALAIVLGPRLIADTGDWGTYAWAEFVLGVPGVRVAGGTDEIQRNIVGERVLGLPR